MWKFLPRNGPSGWYLPALDVAGGPVVQQAEAGDVAGRRADRDRMAEFVAGTDPDAEFEFVVEVTAMAEGGGGVCRLSCPPGQRTGTPGRAKPEAQ